MSKQYGLILPDKQGNKKPPPIFTTKNVFGNDSDSDDDGKIIPKKPVTTGEKVRRQALAVQEKALAEDPSVYLYDELYDDMEVQKKIVKSAGKTEEKKPKYIEKLLQTAEKRKRETERRIERQVQKEREEEGEKFADKEAFVTSSYKKKLEEMKLEEEKEKRENYLEEIGDVTKQSDLGGFYRHLYEQKLRPEKVLLREKNDEQSAGPSEIKNENLSSSEAKSNSDKEINQPEEKEKKIKKEKRSYRKRRHSGDKDKDQSDSDDAEETRINLDDIKLNKKSRTHMASNIDADSDFSIDDTSSSDDEEEGSHKKKTKRDKSNADKPKTLLGKSTIEENQKSPESKEGDVKPDDEETFKKPDDVKSLTKENGDKEKKETENKKADEIKEVKEIKPKIDIWKKRTVGDVLDQALQRYYQRKAARCHQIG